MGDTEEHCGVARTGRQELGHRKGSEVSEETLWDVMVKSVLGGGRSCIFCGGETEGILILPFNRLFGEKSHFSLQFFTFPQGFI